MPSGKSNYMKTELTTVENLPLCTSYEVTNCSGIACSVKSSSSVLDGTFTFISELLLEISLVVKLSLLKYNWNPSVLSTDTVCTSPLIWSFTDSQLTNSIELTTLSAMIATFLQLSTTIPLTLPWMV